MAKDNKPILTGSQVIGAIALAVMLLAVLLIVNLVPQHTLRVQVWDKDDPSNLCEEKNMISQHDMQVYALHVFDPNTADSVELLALGLPKWQVKAMMNYRRKGGRYRRPFDLNYIPGMTDSLYHLLEPYISIDTMPFFIEREQWRIKDSLRRDSLYRIDTLRYHRTEYIDTVLELNSADTAALQLLRGIGSYTARCIVRYREQLGGYYDVAQLHDLVEEDERLSSLDTLTAYFAVNTDSVKTIPVNYASVHRLARHPYLRFQQAKEIYELRRRRIKLNSIDDIKGLDSMSESDIERIKIYLSFEK